MFIFGAHVSISKGFSEAARKTIEKYHANAMQIFTKNPRGRSHKEIDPDDLKKYLDYRKKLKYVVAHSSYLLNFGKPLKDIEWAKKDLLLDFQRMDKLKGDAIVVHVGKAMDGDRKKALKNVVENAKTIINETSKSKVDYLIENTAGQGNEVGWNFDDLKEIWKGLKGESPRLKFCLDTAHMWGAGYDISSPKKTKDVLKNFDQLIGKKQIGCFHFNDSKKECGSKVDRHDNLGNGKIDLKGLGEIVEFAIQNSIPVILETPDKNPGDRANDLEILTQLSA